jgi:hypothetical protein
MGIESGKKGAINLIVENGEGRKHDLLEKVSTTTEILGSFDGTNATQDEMLEIARRIKSTQGGNRNLGEEQKRLEEGQNEAVEGVGMIATGFRKVIKGMGKMRLNKEQKEEIAHRLVGWISEIMEDTTEVRKRRTSLPDKGMAEVVGKTDDDLRIGGMVLGQLLRANLLDETEVRRGKKGGKGTKMWLNSHAELVLKEAITMRKELKEKEPTSYFFVDRIKAELLERVRVVEEQNK